MAPGIKPTTCVDCGRACGPCRLCPTHLVERTTRERAAQGLPPRLEDPTVIAAIQRIHARTRPTPAVTSAPLAPADAEVATSAGRGRTAPPLAS